MERIRLTKTVAVGKSPFNAQRAGTVLNVVDDPVENTDISPADAKAFKAMGYAKDYTADDAKGEKEDKGEKKDKNQGNAPANKAEKRP